MKEKIKNTISSLKLHVQKNLELIRANEKNIRHLLEKREVSENRSELLARLSAENKKLLNENNDFIKLQFDLLKFMDKHAERLEIHTEHKEQVKDDESLTDILDTKTLTIEQALDLTISEELEFNNEHPFFMNEEFFQHLMDYYLSIEDYEKCQVLSETRKTAEN